MERPIECRTGPEGQPARKNIANIEAAKDISQEEDRILEALKSCKFNKVGCKFTGNRFEVDLHMDIASEKHLDYVCKSIQEIKSEYIKKESKVISKHESKLKTLQEYICKQNTVIKELHENNRMLETSSKDFEHQLSEVTSNNSRLIEEINRLKMHTNALQEEMVENKDVNYSGCFVWKVKDAALHAKNAIQKQNLSIYSRPFYTSRYGYKLRAQLFLNGLGATTGEYASIYFHLLPTDHDDILGWPFKHKITFSLLEQSAEKTDNISYTMVPSVDDNQFKQPSVNMSEGRGFNKFFSVDLLKSEKYVKNDCIFIKLRVHCKNNR